MEVDFANPNPAICQEEQCSLILILNEKELWG